MIFLTSITQKLQYKRINKRVKREYWNNRFAGFKSKNHAVPIPI